MKNKTFYDVNNGTAASWTFDEIIESCKENPSCDKDEKFFFDDDDCWYSLQDFADESGHDIVWDDGYCLIEKGN